MVDSRVFFDANLLNVSRYEPPILRTIVREVLSFPVRTWANESSSRIEFLLDQNHRQIRPLCLDQHGNRIQY